MTDARIITQLLQKSNDAYQRQGYSQAVDLLNDILLIKSDSVEAIGNLAYLNYLQGHYLAAIHWAQKSIALNAEFIPSYSHLGIALLAENRLHEAIETLKLGIDKAESQQQPAADLWINLGLAYQKSQQLDLAIQALKTGTKLDASSTKAYINLGSALQDQGYIDNALSAYEKALVLTPDQPAAISNYLMCLQYANNQTSLSLKQSAQEKTQSLNRTEISVGGEVGRECSTGLKIGFVSGDFRAHPVGWFFSGILDALRNYHPNNSYYIYANNPTVTQDSDSASDEVSRKIHKCCHHWRNIYTLSDMDVCHLIKTDAIDVLIDLSGHTALNRLPVFAKRPAPLQLSWIGFPASTGLSEIDGVILGRYLADNLSQAYFTEPLYSLEAAQFSYAPPSYLPPVADSPVKDNLFITFGCFNNISKINDGVIICWSKILHQVPKSRLILKWKTFFDEAMKLRLLKRFHSLGIEQSRIELRAVSPHEAMLREYADIDIALDPFPFCGGLTSYEACWMGVPVITLYSHRPLSRQTYALNATLGFHERSSTTMQDYIDSAVKLACDSQQLIQARPALRGLAEASELANHQAVADSLLSLISFISAEK